MVKVVQFQRKPGATHFSMERIFEDVRSELPSDIDCQVRVNRFPSQGLLGRLMDAVASRGARAEVNHIIGDVHYLAWFWPRRGTLLTIHDCVSLERLKGIKRWLLWLLWYRIPIGRAERLTVVSEFTREQLGQWVDLADKAVDVIPPTCARVFFDESPKPMPETPEVLVVGTGHNKNLLRVIEACRGLDISLSIIGRLTVEQEQALEDAELPYRTGERLSLEEVAQRYRDCDILAFPSTYEGFGMPIIEAQAMGRPVITSNTCSMPEAAAGAALLVDPFDVDAIRGAIQKLLGDDAYRSTLVARGFQNARGFSPEVVASKYAAVYRELGDRENP